jgi:signal transduction histidine kinase
VYLLYALLFASLATMAVMASRARIALRSRRTAIDLTLRNEAEFAAWLYSAMAADRLRDAARSSFAPLEPYLDRDSSVALPEPAVLLATTTGLDYCSRPEARGRYAFRFDVPERTLTFAGTEPDSTLRAWLATGIAARAGAQHPGAPALTFLIRSATENGGEQGASSASRMGGSSMETRVSGAPAGVIYKMVRSATGTPRAIYGRSSCLVAGPHSVFAQVATEQAILPPALIKTRSSNDSLFSVSITDLSGHQLYRSAVQYRGPYTTSVLTLGPDGDIVTHITLRSDLLNALLSSTLPPAQMPVIASLLMLVAALVVAALIVLHQEDRMARMRSEFLAGISHELRTPLAQIRVFAELLRLGHVRSEAARVRSLAIIDQEARRLTQLVDNVLQFTRSEHVPVALALADTELAPEIRDVIELFEPIAAARQVQLVADLVDDVEVTICPHAFRQVLLNLLDNAVKFGPPGQTVHLGMVVLPECVRLVIDDEGPGIPRREWSRIWKPFYRVSRGDREAEREGEAQVGSGLGLAVVRDLVQRQHGRVWVDQSPKGGTRLVVELPVAQPEEPHDDSPPAVVAEGSLGEV